MTHQVTLELNDEEFQTLQHESQTTGKALPTLVLESYLQGRKSRTAFGQFKKYAGFFSTGPSDMSINHDEYLGQAAIDTHGK